MLHQDGMEEDKIMRNPKRMMIGMNHRKRGEQWHQRTILYLIWKSNPKISHILWTGSRRCINVDLQGLGFLLSDRSHGTPASCLRGYPPSGGCCRLVGNFVAQKLWRKARRFPRIRCSAGKTFWKFYTSGSSQGRITRHPARAVRRRQSIFHSF